MGSMGSVQEAIKPVAAFEARLHSRWSGTISSCERQPPDPLNFLNPRNRRDRSKSSTLPKRVVIIEKERVLPRNPGRAFDLRDERRKVSNDRAVQRAAAEERTGEAFVHEGLVIRQQSHRIEDGH